MKAYAWAVLKFWALVIAAAGLLAGCSLLGPSDKMIQALAASDRSWCMSITSIYGTARVSGTGVKNGTVVCSQEGMNVKSGPP